VDKIDQSIPKLIIESENDPLIEPELRTLLRDYYPESHLYTFHNAGHFPYINRGEEYNKIINEFIHGG
jgi:pimeloyl-ACP methyl ester carboxylesterase